ncbi:MAG: hypothetical protein JSU85_10710 [Candidatus Zixiibacteriota bacterium]|nr:MAG: hypothetical protein JSU85_10710 [candidate division Zixibacteria bacterium]
MRFLKYLLVLLNIVLIVSNLYLVDHIFFNYFNILPSYFLKSILNEKLIVIDDEVIKLPKGYFLHNSNINNFGGPVYSARKIDGSYMEIIAYRPLQDCRDNYIGFYLKAHFELLESSPEPITYGVISQYKYGDADVYIYRKPMFNNEYYKYSYFFKAIIPDKCIQISLISFNDKIEDFLSIIGGICFKDRNAEFVNVSKANHE